MEANLSSSCACRVDAGKVELDGTQYLGFSLPFSISQLIWIEVLLVGGAEIYRNRSTDLQERIYPGDPPLPHHLTRLPKHTGRAAHRGIYQIC